MIRVIVNGAQGRMGRVSVQAVQDAPQFQCVAECTQADNLAQAIAEQKPDVVVDFTVPDCAFENTQTIISAGVHPVIGTTGLTDAQIDTLAEQCKTRQLGGIIAPNFSLGAILMMRYAREIAKFFPKAEIVERHHDKKLDAPSGTALKTAKLLEEHIESVPIHSVRLPGYFASQSVTFGGTGETLTLHHDAIDRGAMMPGLLMACEKVMTLNSLIYGLEGLL